MHGFLIGWFGLDLLPLRFISHPLDRLINKAVSASLLLRLYLHSFLPNKRVKYCALLSGKLPGHLFHSLSIVTTVGASICVFSSSSNQSLSPGACRKCWGTNRQCLLLNFCYFEQVNTLRDIAPPALLQPKSLTLYVHE